MSISADEADIIFHHGHKYTHNEKDPQKTNRMERLGLYFVEYMRTRFHGNGIPDTVPRMGQVFESVGRGMDYKQAFERAYGVSPDQVTAEIVALFKRTEANPVERFKGTRFEKAE